MDLVARLKQDARDLGFDVCRVASAAATPDLSDRLGDWLDRGRHGDMVWMKDTAGRRAHPHALWADVRSVVMLGMNYGPDGDPLANLGRPQRGNISVYARHRDYHDVVKGKLKLLASKLVSRAGGDVKVFVDTAPAMEKPLAMQAGLGWQGKHTNLVSREFGSWLFLGSIFTTVDFEPDAAERDHCGQCRACIDACPTGAIVAPYQFDARRCISYLTIEHEGAIPHAFRAAIGNRIYGCDDCLAVCPWNKFAQTAREAKLVAREDLRSPRLRDLVSLDDAAFRALFSGSPVKRIGHARFLRNVLIAIGNSGDASVVPLVKARLAHDVSLVRGAAVWALSRLLSVEAFAALAADACARETDAAALDEWRMRSEERT
jgi:epoxyqueuosine reductase